MPSLTDHLITADHARLPFRRDCPVCRRERLAGTLPDPALVPRRVQAGLAAATLAASGLGPTASALADEGSGAGQGGASSARPLVAQAPVIEGDEAPKPPGEGGEELEGDKDGPGSAGDHRASPRPKAPANDKRQEGAGSSAGSPPEAAPEPEAPSDPPAGDGPAQGAPSPAGSPEPEPSGEERPRQRPSSDGPATTPRPGRVGDSAPQQGTAPERDAPAAQNEKPQAEHEPERAPKADGRKDDDGSSRSDPEPRADRPPAVEPGPGTAPKPATEQDPPADGAPPPDRARDQRPDADGAPRAEQRSGADPGRADDDAPAPGAPTAEPDPAPLPSAPTAEDGASATPPPRSAEAPLFVPDRDQAEPRRRQAEAAPGREGRARVRALDPTLERVARALPARERRVVAAERELTRDLGRPPGEDELAQRTGLDSTEVAVARRAVKRALRGEHRRREERRAHRAAEPETYRVEAGDSLWAVARRELGADASNAQVARFVARLWAVNERRIGTGDPDLIHPGQKLRMPS